MVPCPGCARYAATRRRRTVLRRRPRTVQDHTSCRRAGSTRVRRCSSRSPCTTDRSRSRPRHRCPFDYGGSQSAHSPVSAPQRRTERAHRTTPRAHLRSRQSGIAMRRCGPSANRRWRAPARSVSPSVLWHGLASERGAQIADSGAVGPGSGRSGSCGDAVSGGSGAGDHDLEDVVEADRAVGLGAGRHRLAHRGARRIETGRVDRHAPRMFWYSRSMASNAGRSHSMLSTCRR